MGHTVVTPQIMSSSNFHDPFSGRFFFHMSPLFSHGLGNLGCAHVTVPSIRSCAFLTDRHRGCADVKVDGRRGKYRYRQHEGAVDVGGRIAANQLHRITQHQRPWGSLSVNRPPQSLCCAVEIMLAVT